MYTEVDYDQAIGHILDNTLRKSNLVREAAIKVFFLMAVPLRPAPGPPELNGSMIFFSS